MIVVDFLSWTFILYWIHRLGHKNNWVMRWHGDHHKFINRTGNKNKWELNNLILFNDTIKSTVDLWITEVIPTIIFCSATGAWWVFVFYYIWAAFLQEQLEHNKNLNVYLLTAGQWHLVHHFNPSVNFGLFFPMWDKLFKTEYKND